MNKCMVIGSTVCDVMIYVDQLPGRQGDVHISHQSMSLGGCAFNALNVLHHLEIPYTFISPVGTGLYGDFVAKELKARGIRSKVYSNEENGCCYCFVEEDGERTFISYHKVEYTFKPEWIADCQSEDYDYVYLCGLEVEETDGPQLVAALQPFKGKVVFCPGPRGNLIDSNLLEKVYALNPILHMNESEIVLLGQGQTLEESVLNLYAKTGNQVVVTLGDRGALFYDGETFQMVAGYPNQVVDTVGAGDSHAGGMMAALAKGHSMSEALDFANRVSSQVVGVSGVHLSAVTYQDLQTYL